MHAVALVWNSGKRLALSSRDDSKSNTVDHVFVLSLFVLMQNFISYDLNCWSLPDILVQLCLMTQTFWPFFDSICYLLSLSVLTVFSPFEEDVLDTNDWLRTHSKGPNDSSAANVEVETAVGGFAPPEHKLIVKAHNLPGQQCRPKLHTGSFTVTTPSDVLIEGSTQSDLFEFEPSVFVTPQQEVERQLV